MKTRLLLTLSMCILVFSLICPTVWASGGGAVLAADRTKHFDPKGKMPSKFTIELQNGLRKSLAAGKSPETIFGERIPVQTLSGQKGLLMLLGVYNFITSPREKEG